MPANDAVKVTSNAFRSLLGMEVTRNANPTAQPDNVSFVRRFSKVESRTHLARVYTAPRNISTSRFSAAGIISYLKPIHKKIGDELLNADKMKALAPEIEQSRILVSSSIMSPNDLQNGEFTFTFPDVPGVDADEELAAQLADVYKKFYNDTLELAIKSYDWIGEIQYRSGAKPILILPCATHQELANRTPEDAKKTLIDLTPGSESFASYAKAQNANDDYFYSGKKWTWADTFKSMSDNKAVVSSMIPSMENYGVKIPTEFLAKNQLEKRNTIESEKSLYNSDYLAGLEDMVVQLKTRLEEGDVLKLSENTELLRFGSISKDKWLNRFSNKLGNRYAGLDIKKHPVIEPIVQLDPYPDKYKHMGHPTIIQLPVESVIPVFIPGAASEHIGYFVLLDEHGQPLTIEKSGLAKRNSAGECDPSTVNAAYEAMFGPQCGKSYFNQDNTLENASKLIFETLVDRYIKDRIKGIIGRIDTEISRMNAISTLLFYRLLEKKETTLVFVPPVLLHYFAFDIDSKTGLGKSKLAEIQFILSLRTTLMMANVLSSVNDAIENKKITFGVDDKTANLEMVMDLLANIFVARQKLQGSIDPAEIMRDMYSNSLTLIPKNIPGLSDLSVEVENASGGNSTKVDDSVLEYLTNLLVSHLDVPPAALNQLSEPEFARSLVTYNLFFSKKISRYQRIWCKQMANFIHSHSKFDPIFQKAVAKVLLAASKKRLKETLPPKVKKLKDNNPNNYESEEADAQMLHAVLEGVSLSLPSPNIVVDKTQFEELRNFMGNLNELADNFFPQELIPNDDMAAQAALPVVKAKWKREQMMRFLETVGNFDMVEVPSIDDINPSELIDFIQTMQNVNQALTLQRENIGNAGSEGGFGSESGYGGGMGGEMGGEFGGEMGGGEEMNLGGGEELDLGGMEEETTTETETTEEGTTTTETSTTTASMYLDLVKKKKK